MLGRWQAFGVGFRGGNKREKCWSGIDGESKRMRPVSYFFHCFQASRRECMREVGCVAL